MLNQRICIQLWTLPQPFEKAVIKSEACRSVRGGGRESWVHCRWDANGQRPPRNILGLPAKQDRNGNNLRSSDSTLRNTQRRQRPCLREASTLPWLAICSTIHTKQEVELTYVLSYRWMDEERSTQGRSIQSQQGQKSVTCLICGLEDTVR